MRQERGRGQTGGYHQMLPQERFRKPTKNLGQGNKYPEFGFAPGTTLDKSANTTVTCMMVKILNAFLSLSEIARNNYLYSDITFIYL
jgi:hypothetical protein